MFYVCSIQNSVAYLQAVKAQNNDILHSGVLVQVCFSSAFGIFFYMRLHFFMLGLSR